MPIPLTINHIDCFSGPGGICTGFKASGISTIAAIEKVKSCVETYNANHPEVTVLNKDIREVTSDELVRIVGGRSVHILTSGMPCETFSTAGSKSRSSYDFRQQLYSEAIRLAVAVSAKFILFENVPAIETKRVTQGGDRFVVQDIEDELSMSGYRNFKKVVLNAHDFGIPQSRNRFFLLACSDDSLQLEAPIPQDEPRLTVRDAFVGLPELKANDRREPSEFLRKTNSYSRLLQDRSFWKVADSLDNSLTYHRAPKHRLPTIDRFKLLEPGESLVDLFTKFPPEEVRRLQSQRILPNKWYIQRNKRLVLDAPSKTVTSHCLDELVHPTADRSLTVREVARLQSFPDFYDFKGGPYICPHKSETQDKYEQIGDAVPPLLAFAWGVVLSRILRTTGE